jgi:hypothetical protein
MAEARSLSVCVQKPEPLINFLRMVFWRCRPYGTFRNVNSIFYESYAPMGHSVCWQKLNPKI